MPFTILSKFKKLERLTIIGDHNSIFNKYVEKMFNLFAIPHELIYKKNTAHFILKS